MIAQSCLLSVFQFELYPLTVGRPSVRVLSVLFLHTRSISSTPAFYSHGLLFCTSIEAFSGSAREQTETDCSREKERLLFRSDTCWRNVTHLSMTPHFISFCECMCGYIVFLNTTGAKPKKQGRADGQEHDGGNFSLIVLLCVTAVWIADLMMDGKSET